MFSWLAFLQRHQIPYKESGSHTHKGNVYVWCPWCRDADQNKFRLGLHLTSTRFGCWKDERHKGRDAPRLIRALIGCTWQQALLEAQEGGARSGITDLKDRLRAVGARESGDQHDVLTFPDDFVSFRRERTPPLSWFRRYVQGRGFPGKHADRLAKRYGLLAAIGGRYDRRVIVPFHDLEGRLIGWSGRAIGRHEELRYLTEGQTRGVIYNGYRALHEGGRLLVLVEGPFDALKVDYYGADHGIRAVAATGLGNVGNIGLLTTVFAGGRYERLMSLLDASALAESMRVRRALRHLPAMVGRVPGFKDPGDFTPEAVLGLLAQAFG